MTNDQHPSLFVNLVVNFVEFLSPCLSVSPRLCGSFPRQSGSTEPQQTPLSPFSILPPPAPCSALPAPCSAATGLGTAFVRLAQRPQRPQRPQRKAQSVHPFSSIRPFATPRLAGIGTALPATAADRLPRGLEHRSDLDLLSPG